GNRQPGAGNLKPRARNREPRLPAAGSRVISKLLGRHWMRRALRVGLAAAGVVALGTIGSGTFAQAPAAQAQTGAWMSATPANDLPNPYNTIEGWAKLPAGREWGSTSSVDIDKDGKSVWVAERCGTRPNPQGGAPVSTNSCWDAAANKMLEFDPVLKFDSTGKLVKSFG